MNYLPLCIIAISSALVALASIYTSWQAKRTADVLDDIADVLCGYEAEFVKED